MVKGTIYFAMSKDRSLCKVGWSRNPHQRVRHIQTYAPFEIELVAYMNGIPRDQESYWHEQFDGSHVFGEWYSVSGNLLLFLLGSSGHWLAPWDFDEFYLKMTGERYVGTTDRGQECES